jgi:hypothetical protein
MKTSEKNEILKKIQILIGCHGSLKKKKIIAQHWSRIKTHPNDYCISMGKPTWTLKILMSSAIIVGSPKGWFTLELFTLG